MVIVSHLTNYVPKSIKEVTANQSQIFSNMLTPQSLSNMGNLSYTFFGKCGTQH